MYVCVNVYIFTYVYIFFPFCVVHGEAFRMQGDILVLASLTHAALYPWSVLFAGRHQVFKLMFAHLAI